MSLKKFTKDPDAILDYTIDWADWLAVAGDTITEVTAVSGGGVTVDSTSFTATTTTVWLSGGAAGQSSDVVVHITTAGGREDDRTITIVGKEL